MSNQQMPEKNPATPRLARLYVAITLFAITGWVLFASCSSRGSSTSPDPFLLPTRTPTPTPSLYWQNGMVGGGTIVQAGAIATPTVVCFAGLDLLVNGTPNPTANVYLTGTNLSAPLTLPYYGLSQSGGLDYAHYETYNSFTYATNETYTLTCEAMGVTTWATQTAPGDITASWDSDGAVTYISWAVEGNDDWMHILDASLNPVTILWPDLGSPLTLDPSTPYPSPGQYIIVFISSNYTQAVTNAVSGSNYYVQDVFQKYFNKP
jgi:hypothetical protein